MKPQKHKCSSEYYDRLSEMPDEVIVHFLSYMPIVDAVRTMLIRRFGNLWTLVPTLNFDAEEIVNKMVPDGKWSSDGSDVVWFYNFVRNVLMLHKTPVIDKFHLILGWSHEQGRSEVGDDIRMWLTFALDKQAKEIVFHDVSSDLTNSSDLPNFISQSLVTLELSHCCIYPQPQMNLGSLKKLILSHTYMCEEAFQQFICGCPSLEELHMVEPAFNPNNISFRAPNIRKLSLVLVVEEVSYDPWVLDFPNLKTLDLEIDQMPDVIDVSSVQDIYLKKLFLNMGNENELRKFNIFLEKFSRSEVFQLSSNASEPFFHSIDDSRLLQIRWKCVVLRLRIFCQSCLLGIYQLMRSSKHLEELTIYTTTELTYTSVCNTPSLFSGRAFKDRADLPPVELFNPCVMPKLKTFTLHGYAKPWKHQLQLIEFFLKSATVLEKLIIVLNKRQSTAVEKLDFVMHVSTFQRSSPSARVYFL